MRLEYKNIGPISKAEMELKDLTIIAGANNTGKTYLAYILYGLQKIVQNRYTFSEIEANLPFDPQKAAEELLATGTFNYPVKDFDKMAMEAFEQAFKFSSDYIASIFSSPPDDFKGAEFFFHPDYSTESLREGSGQYLGDIVFEIVGSFKNNVLSFHLNAHGLPMNKLPKDELKNLLINTFAMTCLPVPLKPFILSAERFGIPLFFKELDFTKSRLVEMMQKIKDKGISNNTELFDLMMDYASSRYAQPIKDNIDFTRDVEFTQNRQSTLVDGKLSDDIKDMLNGYFKYKNGEIRFISKARKKGKFDIPLHLASSSARGMSILYFYLKHVAKKNQLLIIDEPESHLDTNNQIEMARVLARCVNNGLKVLITTHSDYLIKEFNNLIMLSNDFEDKEEFLKSNKQYTKKDYLKPESVGAYLCEKGTLTRCDIDYQGMDIPSFDKTIDEINRVSNDLVFFTHSKSMEK